MILARAVYASMYVIGAVLLLYLAMIGALAVVQRRLVFHPDTHPPGPPPADIANAQLLQTRTPDGLVLHSWFLRPADATRPVVLFLQGNAGHLGDRVDRLRAFAGLGWGALLLGYRGYGGNEGAPSERGLLIDARTGLAALRAMDIASGRIVVWGESIGTGIAVPVAADAAVGALVLEAPFTSLADVAVLQMPWVPVRLLLRDRFASLGIMKRVLCPVFVLAGGRDTLVPPAMSRRLFDAAGDPKRFLLEPLAGHNDLATPAALRAVVGFLAEVQR
jgi:fermentation-respiration switch protein FrsA (DUF1100 family)